MSSTGGDEGSSSSTPNRNPNSSPNPNPTTANPNPSPPPPEETPRQRRGRANAPTTPSSAPPPTSRPLFSTPPPPPPVMGSPGRSAFAPYGRPRPLHWSAPPSSSRPRGRGRIGFGGRYGLFMPMSVPVGGAAAGEGGGGLRIGGAGARKRPREDGEQPPGDGGEPVICSICGKSFRSLKALFGHMRSHPDRGWKGAHPPPTFRAAEEFADLHAGLNRPEATPVAPAVEDGGGGGQVEGNADGGGGGQRSDQGEGVGGGGEDEAAGDQAPKYKLPDLNNSPPSE